MAEPQSNARLRADAGATTSGVIHVRTRLTADFTVISNALAQRRGSAVTVGVAAYISSLPDGSPVSIAALCQHFSEGEILISRALRELEEAGYLERRRERTSGGQVRTRTYFYDVPGGAVGDGPPEPPKPSRARKATVGEEAPASPTREQSEKPASLSDADPQAVAVLASLRRVDPRLVLSEQEAVRLAPGVAQWLAAGIDPSQITSLLTARLPDRLLSRPAGILAFRLREAPLPAPPPRPLAEGASRPVALPFQTCDGCERAFRAPEPGRCRGCRTREPGDLLRAAC
ncbi:winged helix DNA-binding protein [Streptomyces sp. NPDC002611]